MRDKFAEIAFTPAVKDIQSARGSRDAYARMEAKTDVHPQTLTENEVAFIERRDSFYLSTLSETGWPYIQHRGGAPGFVQVLGPRQIGLFDYRGNRQYVSTGNLSGSDRVSLFFMDYPNQARLKMFGHARVITVDEAQEIGLRRPSDGRIQPEAAMVIDVAGYDWNCPKYITPRFSAEDIRPGVEALQQRIAELEQKLAERGG